MNSSQAATSLASYPLSHVQSTDEKKEAYHPLGVSTLEMQLQNVLVGTDTGPIEALTTDLQQRGTVAEESLPCCTDCNRNISNGGNGVSSSLRVNLKDRRRNGSSYYCEGEDYHSGEWSGNTTTASTTNRSEHLWPAVKQEVIYGNVAAPCSALGTMRGGDADPSQVISTTLGWVKQDALAPPVSSNMNLCDGTTSFAHCGGKVEASCSAHSEKTQSAGPDPARRLSVPSKGQAAPAGSGDGEVPAPSATASGTHSPDVAIEKDEDIFGELATAAPPLPTPLVAPLANVLPIVGSAENPEGTQPGSPLVALARQPTLPYCPSRSTTQTSTMDLASFTREVTDQGDARRQGVCFDGLTIGSAKETRSRELRTPMVFIVPPLATVPPEGNASLDEWGDCFGEFVTSTSGPTRDSPNDSTCSSGCPSPGFLSNRGERVHTQHGSNTLTSAEEGVPPARDATTEITAASAVSPGSFSPVPVDLYDFHDGSQTPISENSHFASLCHESSPSDPSRQAPMNAVENNLASGSRVPLVRRLNRPATSATPAASITLRLPGFAAPPSAEASESPTLKPQLSMSLPESSLATRALEQLADQPGSPPQQGSDDATNDSFLPGDPNELSLTSLHRSLSLDVRRPGMQLHQPSVMDDCSDVTTSTGVISTPQDGYLSTDGPSAKRRWIDLQRARADELKESSLYSRLSPSAPILPIIVPPHPEEEEEAEDDFATDFEDETVLRDWLMQRGHGSRRLSIPDQDVPFLSESAAGCETTARETPVDMAVLSVALKNMGVTLEAEGVPDDAAGEVPSGVPNYPTCPARQPTDGDAALQDIGGPASPLVLMRVLSALGFQPISEAWLRRALQPVGVDDSQPLPEADTEPEVAQIRVERLARRLAGLPRVKAGMSGGSTGSFDVYSLMSQHAGASAGMESVADFKNIYAEELGGMQPIDVFFMMEQRWYREKRMEQLADVLQLHE